MLFEQGQALQVEGHYERALERYQRSRVLVRGFGNTFGVANCLETLGRLDEALELYQEVVRDFPQHLSDTNRAQIGASIGTLSEKTGALEISTNAEDVGLIIDDARRTRIRSGQRIHLMPGEHSIEVTSNGYYSTSFVARVEPSKVESRRVKLIPVGAFVRITIDEASGKTVEEALARKVRVLVDGGSVGTAPWEGSVVPGEHIVQLEGEGMGSAPTRVEAIVRAEQIIALRLVPAAKVAVAADREEATIEWGSLRLGRESWSGTLPVGEYTITATAPGFQRASLRLRVALNADNRLRINLEKDRTFWVGAVAGAAYAPTLNSGPEEACPDRCTNHLGAFGGTGGARAGFTLASGWSFDLQGGVLGLYASFARIETNDFLLGGQTVTAAYAVKDKLLVWGPHWGVGVGRVFWKRRAFDAVLRLGVDIMYMRSHDAVEGTMREGGVTTTISPAGFAGERFQPTARGDYGFFFSAEVAARMKVGPLRFGAGLAASVFVTKGPNLGIGYAVPTAPEKCPEDISVHCLPATNIFRDEVAYRPFFAFSPRLTMQYEFR